MRSLIILTLCCLLVSISCQNNKCTLLTGFNGVSDFVPYKGFFLASHDDRSLALTNQALYESTSGGILLVDSAGLMAYPLPLNNFPRDINFHPQGLYLLGNILYVINHAGASGGERIEQFRIDDLEDMGGSSFLNVMSTDLSFRFSLTHIYAFKLGDQYSGMISDLVVIDSTQFFFSTMFPQKTSLLNGLLSPNLNSQATFIYYCNSSTLNCKKLPASQGIMLKGLSYDPIKKILYSSDTLAKTIRIYQILFYDSGLVRSLRPLTTINLGYFPSMISFDAASGLLYMGILQNANDIATFAREYSTTGLPPSNFASTSGILTMDTNNNNQLFTLLLQSDFLFISSGFRSGNALLFGSFFADGIQICDLTPTSA